MKNKKLLSTAPRESLMALLDELSEVKSTIYIHAPAGYGKTFTTQLWLARQKEKGIKQAWITLDEYDNNVANFCRRYVSALLGFQPDNAKLREYAAHPAFDTAPDEFAVRAISSFIDDNQKHILVFDDLHMVNENILRLMAVLYKRRSPNRIVISLGRDAPTGFFAELALKDVIAVIDAARLCFSSKEIKELFDNNGRHITKTQADNIYASTGGWAIGLRSMLLSGDENYNTALLEKHLDPYLKEHVWEKWDAKIRECMMKTSVVEELTPDIFNCLADTDSGGEILAKLVRENAYLRQVGEGVFRFHDLFRDFLLTMLEEKGEAVKNEQLRTAGNWFYNAGDYFKAISYYVKCKDYGGVEKAYSILNEYSSKNANVDTRMSIIDFMKLNDMPDGVFDKYPTLYPAHVLGCFLGGKAEEMARTLDRFKEAVPLIAGQQPALLETFAFSQGLDFRQPLIEQCKKLLTMPLPKFAAGARVSTITQNLPFFHRSQRDYSEWALDLNSIFTLLRSTYGVLIGAGYDVIEDCIVAGLAYEQGKTDKALEYALSANSKLRADIVDEVKFCAMIILTSVLRAGGQTVEADKILDNIRDMIQTESAFYLTPNFRAFLFTLKLNNGDKDAAREWLTSYSESPYSHLPFYKIYQHFTTARAYIVTGDYNTAILFLKKLLTLSESYRRPLDVIESYILLAIAYWKKGRGLQNEALRLLEQAIREAEEYEYTQLFANNGPDISNMLHRLQKRVVQKDSDISMTKLKTLYVLAMTQAKHSRGMTGGTVPENMAFTDRQKEVMGYLCEGFTHKEIGEKMGLKPSAIKSHMILIYKKLDVTNAVDAMIKIKELGLLK